MGFSGSDLTPGNCLHNVRAQAMTLASTSGVAMATNPGSARTSTHSEASIAARMDRLPITGLHRRATVVIGLGQFFDLYEIFLAGVLSSVLASQFELGKGVVALLLASAFIGMFLGAITLGRVADRLGRRRAFLLSLSIYSLFSLLSAVSPGPAMLVATRFLAGVGVGAEPPIADSYLSDLLPPAKRGRYIAWAYTIGFLGVPASGFLARGLATATVGGIDGWRWMFVIGALGAVVVAVLRRSLPESPRWLAAQGRLDEADAVVRRFEDEVAEGALPAPDPVHAAPVRDRGSFRELLVPPYRARTAMMAVFHLLQSFGYYGFGTLVPLVLVAKGFPVVQSLGFAALTFLGYPVGSLLSLPLVERVERKVLVVGAGLGMAVFGLLFGLSDAPAAIVTFGFVYTVISNVFSNSFHIYQAEIFPTRLRATAAGSTYSLSRLSNALLPFVLLPILTAFGPLAMFLVVSAAMVVVAIDIGVLGPRTTGRDLESVNTAGTDA
jgi:MFS transporter, putative metabolite:H+ symporter